MQWIEKKARAGKKGATQEAEPKEAEEGGAEIIDMMELLKKSVKQGGGAKRGSQAKSPTKSRARTKRQAKSKTSRQSAAAGRKRGTG
jgi:DNA end-binding protein Ku